MAEAALVLLAGALARRVALVGYFRGRLRLLEQATRVMAPAHAVELVARKVDHLEEHTVKGFSQSAEVTTNLNSGLTMLNAVVEMQATAADQNYLRKSGPH
jgi:hypothetical protein